MNGTKYFAEAVGCLHR